MLTGVVCGVGARYKLTGETGSYRYMAPEVFRHEPYNTKVRAARSTCMCFSLE